MCGCKSQCNGCMQVRVVLQNALQWLHDVAWDSCWGGSRSTKPCAFSCKVAAVGDEGQLVCEAVAGALVTTRYRFLLCDLQRVVVHVCVVLCTGAISACKSQCNGFIIVVMFCCHVSIDPCVVATCCCQTSCNGYMNVARDSCWRRSRSTIPCVFPCKWLLPAMKGASCEAVAGAFVATRNRFLHGPLCSATSGCSCVRGSMRLLNSWLHACCHVLLPCAYSLSIV